MIIERMKKKKKKKLIKKIKKRNIHMRLNQQILFTKQISDVKNLIKQFPNDMELGAAIRTLFRV
jgi:hypothetical protein|tara:strand:- start:14 stop:205 length:192 start_codon:yes stop_codon:yes gene_type:complete